MKSVGIVAFTVVTAALIISAGCLLPQSLTVRDSSGAQVALREPAVRIVSTVPSNTEILYALGLSNQVVGVTEYCGKTCRTAGKVVIGGWVNPDYARIRELKPDLIFAFGGTQRKCLDTFREIAPTYCFEPTTVKETFRVILDIGRLTQCTPKAKEIVNDQRDVLARIQARLAARPPPQKLTVARVFGTNSTVMTAGRKSFLTDAIKLAGGVNVFGDADDDYCQVAFERLAALDPDVLLVHGEPNEAAAKRAAFRENADFSKLKAVQNDRVLVYSCDYICHPNAGIADTVEMIARGLYPDNFNRDKSGQ